MGILPSKMIGSSGDRVRHFDTQINELEQEYPRDSDWLELHRIMLAQQVLAVYDAAIAAGEPLGFDWLLINIQLAYDVTEL